MKSTYTKTAWVDNKTPINAQRLNNIENGISTLFTNALSASDIIGDGIKVETTEDGLMISGLLLSMIEERPESSTSEGTQGEYYLDREENALYFCLFNNYWIKINLENF